MKYDVKTSITLGGFSQSKVDEFKYEQEALRTLSDGFHIEKVTPNIIHGAIGVATEAGEILDAVKKTLFYGKDFDIVNLQEEIGDCFWYLAILAHEANMDFDTIMQQNIAKLKSRYPEKFTSEAALVRNLDVERETLEQF